MLFKVSFITLTILLTLKPAFYVNSETLYFEDYVSEYESYIEIYEDKSLNHDGYISINLLNPENVTQKLEIDFPTLNGSLSYWPEVAFHFGSNPLGFELTTREEIEPTEIAKAEFMLETADMFTIMKLNDLEDLLGLATMLDANPNAIETYPNAPPTDVLPIDEFGVYLPFGSYNKSLMREEGVSLNDLIQTQKTLKYLGEIFPNKRKQLIDELLGSLQNPDFTLDKFYGETNIAIHQSENCIFSFSLIKPKNSRDYSFEIASLIVSASCSIEGIEFLINKVSYLDAGKPRLELNVMLSESLNHIIDFVSMTKVHKF